MLKIRLKRTGRKSKPFYRIVLMENLSKRDGKSICELGYYDPIKKIMNFNKNDCITLANSILENSSHDIADFLATSFNGYPILIVQTAHDLSHNLSLVFCCWCL